MLRLEVDFIQTPHCLREAHCGTCRDLEGGRAWRQGLAKRFKVEGVDWPCPRGYDWGHKPQPREPKAVKPEPAFVVERRAACLACDEDEGACPLKRLLKEGRICCAFQARIARPGMVCPKDHWSSLPAP